MLAKFSDVLPKLFLPKKAAEKLSNKALNKVMPVVWWLSTGCTEVLSLRFYPYMRVDVALNSS